MKHFFLTLLLVLLTGCYEVQRDCTAFKTGEFQLNYTVDGVEKSARFVRSNSLSIDYYDGKIDSASVRWINDCEFILTKIDPKRLAEKDPIHFKILTTTDSSYTFEYKLAIKKTNRALRVEKGTAYKIN